MFHLFCLVPFSCCGMLPSKGGRDSIKGHIHIKSNLMQSIQMGLPTVTNPGALIINTSFATGSLGLPLRKQLHTHASAWKSYPGLGWPGHKQNLEEKRFLSHLFGVGDLHAGVP